MPAERAYVPNVPATLMTAEELLAANVTDKRTELVRGVLVVREPAGGRHGAGHLVAAETGFTLARGPDTVRAPDIAFVRRERLPSSVPVGFPELAPDLVVEVLSPDDRPGETLAKVGDWLEAGARLVWVIDPQGRNARVYRADGSQTWINEADHLDGEDVLPGFRCELASIF